MKKTNELQAKGFYLISGKASANSCFIEKILHAKQFLIYANYYLKNYIKVYEYCISKDGWIMLIKINSKKNILSNRTESNDQIWRIISERIRLFLSTYVRVTNKSRGRTGSLVHSEYDRYYFERLGEAKKMIDKIRGQKIKLYQKKKRYRSSKTHYKIPKRLGKGSIFLCSKEILHVKNELGFNATSSIFSGLQKLVSLKIINDTMKSHSLHKKPPKSNNKQKNSP